MPIYNSATDGRIELSFKGKALLMVERDSAVRAISEQDFNANNQGLSRARAALARYMGELETKIEKAKNVLSEVDSVAFKDYLQQAGRVSPQQPPAHFNSLADAALWNAQRTATAQHKANDNMRARERAAYSEGRDTGFDVGRRYTEQLYKTARPASLELNPLWHGSLDPSIYKTDAILRDMERITGLWGTTSFKHGLPLLRARPLESIDLPKKARKKRKAKKVIRKLKRAYSKARKAK